MIHLHGSGHHNKWRPAWPGILAVGMFIVVALISVIRIGWLALVPFGFATLILALLVWFMRKMDTAAKR